MTCKRTDCIHYNICQDYDTRVTLDIYNMAEKCKFFKDKSLIIKLPCKIGDKVYCITIKRYVPLTYKIVEAEVLDYNINRYGICGMKIKQLNSDYIFGISIDKIFLTKEEAETKLKELNGNE